ncbi:uncharacterized protein LOC127242571 [Andrographis paniculata]|uniref:uncharacterized protein LOC127242571 n=1 Tax=Andrographis paniculata TaxID=175694 RepID=UPI0021E71C44|nr:uncharacterized protein LOC127242571 [Andrographis paniculata]
MEKDADKKEETQESDGESFEVVKPSQSKKLKRQVDLMIEIVQDAVTLFGGRIEKMSNENAPTSQDRAKTIIFIRHHLDVPLPSEYLTDFKTVTKYNSAIHQITSQLKLCGEIVTENDKLEKTLSTFHASNVVLQQQYPEQNNELLMKNHQSRPTGSSPFPEANVIFSEQGRGRGKGRGRGRGRESQRGRYTPYNHRGIDINRK